MKNIILFLIFLLTFFCGAVFANVSGEEKRFLENVAWLEDLSSTEDNVFDELNERLRRAVSLTKCEKGSKIIKDRRLQSEIYVTQLYELIDNLNSLAQTLVNEKRLLSKTELAWLFAIRKNGDITNLNDLNLKIESLNIKHFSAFKDLNLMYELARSDGSTNDHLPMSIHRFFTRLDYLKIKDRAIDLLKKSPEGETTNEILSFIKLPSSFKNFDEQKFSKLDAFISKNWEKISPIIEDEMKNENGIDKLLLDSPLFGDYTIFYSTNLVTIIPNTVSVKVDQLYKKSAKNFKNIQRVLDQSRYDEDNISLIANVVPPLKERLNIESSVAYLINQAAEKVCR